MAEGGVSDDKQVFQGRHELPRRVVALIYVNLLSEQQPEQYFVTLPVYQLCMIQYMYTEHIFRFFSKIPFSNKKTEQKQIQSYNMTHIR